jgi:endonuclease-3
MATLSLGRLLAALRRCYGTPPQPVTADPFHMILWEQVGYLVSDAQRKVAFDALRSQVGLSPEAIASASEGTLGRIARLGGATAADERGTRMRRTAELVVRRWNGDLGAALRLPVPEARKALTEFAGIGEPGADKILVFAGTARVLPLDSNGLRVLGRVGLIALEKDYRKTYRNAQARLAPSLPKTPGALIAAHQLLRQHGQTLCKTNAPACHVCPVRPSCAYAS